MDTKNEYTIKRYLSEKEAMEYTSLKQSSIRRYGKKWGAIRHVGRRIVYDRAVIDKMMGATSPIPAAQ